MLRQQTRRKVVRVKDLEHAPEGSLLLCRVCGEQCSACQWDYFQVNPEFAFRHCSRPMSLVTKQTVYTEVPNA